MADLDNESKEGILAGEFHATVSKAGHIPRLVYMYDWGIDAEIEFKDRDGQASGQRVYVQLKCGDSHLRPRGDNEEIFYIKSERHVTYWQSHAYPVYLVIRTSDERIRWMNITKYLQRFGNTRQIQFTGEPFTVDNIKRLGDELVPPHPIKVSEVWTELDSLLSALKAKPNSPIDKNAFTLPPPIIAPRLNGMGPIGSVMPSFTVLAIRNLRKNGHITPELANEIEVLDTARKHALSHPTWHHVEEVLEATKKIKEQLMEKNLLAD